MKKKAKIGIKKKKKILNRILSAKREKNAYQAAILPKRRIAITEILNLIQSLSGGGRYQVMQRNGEVIIYKHLTGHPPEDYIALWHEPDVYTVFEVYRDRRIPKAQAACRKIRARCRYPVSRGMPGRRDPLPQGIRDAVQHLHAFGGCPGFLPQCTVPGPGS